MSDWLRKHSLLMFFVLAYAISWSIEIPLALSVQGVIEAHVPPWTHYLASFGPMLSALILTAYTQGWEAVGQLTSRIFKWRVAFRYYLFSVFGLIGVFLLGVLLNRLISGQWSNVLLLGNADYLPSLGLPGVFILWLLTFGLGEETGWRGFALPRLQANHSAASATLILGLAWACWHLPAFFYRDTYIELGVIGFPIFTVTMLFAAMIFTWLYNSTEGSLLIVILFHALFNWFSASEAGGPFVGPILTIAVILWALMIPRRYGTENCAPVPKQVTARTEQIQQFPFVHEM